MQKLSNSKKNELRELLLKIKRGENYKLPRDWCEISSLIIRNYEGSSFDNSSVKKYFGGENGLMVSTLLPELKLSRWEFKHKPADFWNKENAREFLLWLQKQLKLKSIQDLSTIQSTIIRERYYGKALLKKYEGNLYELFRDCFPEIKWDPLEFNYPLNYFDSVENRKKTTLEIGRRNGINTQEEFHKLAKKHFQQTILGKRLIDRYKGAPSAALKELFPDYEFKEWLFPRVPKNFWKEKKNHRRAIEWLIKDVLKITHSNDFYTVCEDDFDNNNLSSLLRIYKGSRNAIIELYPEYTFSPALFEKIGKQAIRLYCILCHMIPEVDIIWKYKDRSNRFTKSQYPMEIDIFIPELKWGIEYQGAQHEKNPPHWGGETIGKELKERDKEKRKAFTESGVSVFELWSHEWNGSPLELIKLFSGTILGCKFNLEDRLALLDGVKFLPDENPWNLVEEREKKLKKIEQQRLKSKKKLPRQRKKKKPKESKPDLKKNIWMKKYMKLILFYKKNKHADVKKSNSCDKAFITWCETQRALYQDGNLNDEKKELLEKVKFKFTPHNDRWIENYNKLAIYYKVNKHTDIKRVDDSKLYCWLANQKNWRKTEN